jgi:hypothetical protein
MHGLEGPTHTTLLGTVTAIYDVGCCLGSILATCSESGLVVGILS